MPFHQRSNPNSGPSQRSARRGPRQARGWVRGVVDEVDPDAATIRLRVTGGGRAGRQLTGEIATVDAGASKLVLPDADGDDGASLRDVFPGNELEVRFRPSPGGVEEQITATKIQHIGPDMPVGGLRRLWR